MSELVLFDKEEVRMTLPLESRCIFKKAGTRSNGRGGIGGGRTAEET